MDTTSVTNTGDAQEATQVIGDRRRPGRTAYASAELIGLLRDPADVQGRQDAEVPIRDPDDASEDPRLPWPLAALLICSFAALCWAALIAVVFGIMRVMGS